MPAQAAWIAATKTLSAELGPQGVRVNAIAPGVIRTAMTAALSEEVMARQMARCELKRPGLPEEVANTLLWLASDAQLYHRAGYPHRWRNGLRKAEMLMR
jgi:3-oxoacyl-[acyl-carrier protein] reductase